MTLLLGSSVLPANLSLRVEVTRASQMHEYLQWNNLQSHVPYLVWVPSGSWVHNKLISVRHMKTSPPPPPPCACRRFWRTGGYFSFVYFASNTALFSTEASCWVPLFGTWHLSLTCIVTLISQDLQIPPPTWCLLWSPTVPTLAEDKLPLISLWLARSSKFTQEVLDG